MVPVMAGLQDVIGLLYRADWTRLSLSAEVRFESNDDLLQRRMGESPPGGYRDILAQLRRGRRADRATLLIAPGGRYRLEYSDERGLVEGNDGERRWAWWRVGLPVPPSVEAGHDDDPPVRELFRPSLLLGGYTLEVLGPLTACGRDAIGVAATPRLDALRSGPGDRLHDRVEVAVDAELGILLRRADTFQGQLLTFTELTAVTMNPPEAADPARFTPPPGSEFGERLQETLRQMFSGPGWETAKNAAGLAAGGVGALIRYGPHLPGHGASDERFEAAMPVPDPAPLDPADDAPPPDDLLYLLYLSGEPRDLGAASTQWHDLAAITARVPAGAREAGHGGVGYLLDAMTRGKTVARMDARLRVSGPDRYRLEFSSRSGRNAPRAIACDGERRWQVFQDRTLVGPAAPLRDHIGYLADTCWLLRGQLSGGQEITYRGRPARQLRVTRAPGSEDLFLGPLMFFPADAIIDAETGCLLRLLSYAGGTLASWWELDDISTEPGAPDEFRVHVPPGTRTVAETGNPLADTVAVMPGLTGTAARTATETVRRTAGAVSAARSFLDDLRGQRRT
jgi:outer membrane lipoprotein-sorting protein